MAVSSYRRMAKPRHVRNADGTVTKSISIKEFYEARYTQVHALATNDQTFTIFGQGSATADVITWKSGGKNPIASSAGQVLALHGEILGPGSVTIKPVDAAGGAAAVLDAISVVLSKGYLQVWRDTQMIHQDTLYSLFGYMPWYAWSSILTTSGTSYVPAVLSRDNGAPGERISLKRGIYWKPPLDLGNDTTFRVEVNLGGALASTLNTYVMNFCLSVNEFPGSTLDQLRV